ncbi:MAG: hypothetical protein ACFFD4_26400 [Candidatus Odinarchaeota archaeon]
MCNEVLDSMKKDIAEIKRNLRVKIIISVIFGIITAILVILEIIL